MKINERERVKNFTFKHGDTKRTKGFDSARTIEYALDYTNIIR